MKSPPPYIPPDPEISDEEEYAEARPNETLNSTGAGGAELQDSAFSRLPSYTSVSREAGKLVFASLDSVGDSKRDGDGTVSSYGFAGEGVLPEEPPVQQHSRDSERGKVKRDALPVVP